MAAAASTSHQLEPAFAVLHMQLVACLPPVASAEQRTSAEPVPAAVASSHMSAPAAAYYFIRIEAPPAHEGTVLYTLGARLHTPCTSKGC